METPSTRRVESSRQRLFQSPFDVTTVREDLPGFSTPLASLQSRQNVKKQSRQLCWSPIKGPPSKSPPKKKSKAVYDAWSDAELGSLVEFIALHKDLQPNDCEWPHINTGTKLQNISK